MSTTRSRRHSLPSEGSTRGGSLSNGAVTIELVSSGSGESAGRDSSPESTEVFSSMKLNQISQSFLVRFQCLRLVAALQFWSVSLMISFR